MRDFFPSSAFSECDADGSIRELAERELISAGKQLNYIGLYYETVEAILNQRGFMNIEFMDLKDASIFRRGHKRGTVASISIAGNDSFSDNDFFSPDAIVIIQYH